MILRRDQAVLVQGITGKQASFWTEKMLACGTKIVAGSSPGKGGTSVFGIPVYDSAVAAAAAHSIDCTVLFTPPMATKLAVFDALEAGIGNLVVLAEHVPVHDVMEFVAAAKDVGAQLVGPNTAGVVTPGECAVGIMPGFAENIFQPGSIGVISRSGSLGTLICLDIVRAGFGESAFLGIGGDPVLGTTTADALRIFDGDAKTEAVVIVGELGGTMEEEAAEYAAQTKMSSRKPIVAFIAGRSAPPGRRMGHAGAIVIGSRGSGESKVQSLRDAGATVLDSPSDIGSVLRNVLS
ncbi:MAG TPA: CoA-binding protein [Candidatus Acidoferrales bacterium]|nr:CoA-binding protein [Candidatus Acidoferrales bacterium]